MSEIHRELPAGIHVILGDSAAGTFRQTFRGRNVLVDRDVLSVGPTPPRTDLKSWQETRRDFWGFEISDADATVRRANDVLNNIPRLLAADRINLWFATSASEQLFVASTLDLLTSHGADLAGVQFVRFETLSDGSPAKGMGAVHPDQMRAFPGAELPTRQTLDDYLAAWAALTSPDPSTIENFPRDRPHANAWLKLAIQLLKRRYPAKASGLPHFDMRLLDASHRFPKATRIIGEVLGEQWEDGDLIGDHWLFGRMHRMADLPAPLLTLTPHDADMRATQVALTPFGLDVLERRAANHPTNPIEDHVGGVELSSSKGMLWFNHDGSLLKD
jgi:hypothetical protein